MGSMIKPLHLRVPAKNMGAPDNPQNKCNETSHKSHLLPRGQRSVHQTTIDEMGEKQEEL